MQSGFIRRVFQQSAVALLLAMAGCTTLPPEPSVQPAFAALPTADGLLAAAQASLEPPLAGEESAFQLLSRGSDALAWRIALIDSAQSSIDAQYFVWHDDAVGAMLLERLYRAADRGVKVRLLVDDLHLAAHGVFAGNDRELATVDLHPNLEFRLFNPGKYRQGSIGALASLGGSPTQYNRRMHNKLMVVDNHFAIVGGRNIGNEYFGVGEEFNFIDLDLLVTGAVLPQFSQAFDDYWNSELPYPAYALADVDKADFEQVRRENSEYAEDHASLLAAFYAGADQKIAALESGDVQLVRGTASFYRDDPVHRQKKESRLYDAINSELRPGFKEEIISTPYLIPARNFLEYLSEDIAAGADVRILTNSLATNNQPAVHAHYKKYRETFLGMGVELHELHDQPAAELRQLVDTPPVTADFVALHMKASVIDGSRCFVGTMNTDPRSLDINTEDVLDISSPALCSELRDYLLLTLDPDSSWRVSRDADGKLQWTSHEGTVYKQPARSGSQRIMDGIYQITPEGQL